MTHENQWFIITSKEIAAIRWHLKILKDCGPEKCRECAGAITEILITVERRLQ